MLYSVHRARYPHVFGSAGQVARDYPNCEDAMGRSFVPLLSFPPSLSRVPGPQKRRVHLVLLRLFNTGLGTRACVR